MRPFTQLPAYNLRSDAYKCKVVHHTFLRNAPFSATSEKTLSHTVLQVISIFHILISCVSKFRKKNFDTFEKVCHMRNCFGNIFLHRLFNISSLETWLRCLRLSEPSYSEKTSFIKTCEDINVNRVRQQNLSLPRTFSFALSWAFFIFLCLHNARNQSHYREES